MIVFPNAKINIGLYITQKRTDGYHDLETVFYPAPKKDALEIVAAKGKETALHLSGIEVSGSIETNLVWKAWQLIRHDYADRVHPVDIYLHKAIPAGSGLGGGSSDAAFMLHLLNDFFELNLSREQLLAYALELGSDCPFFIINEPCYAKGRGEQLQPLALDISDYEIRLITPPVHCSTAQAFRDITPRPAPFDLQQIAYLPVPEWKHHVSNDFEEVMFRQHPELEAIKNRLYEEGAAYASLSGSGAALFGLFAER